MYWNDPDGGRSDLCFNVDWVNRKGFLLCVAKHHDAPDLRDGLRRRDPGMRRGDHFIAWFDIEFSACHKPVRFSTGPHTKYTHWKQTVFYLADVLTVEAGENVTGKLSCKPNQNNRRDLDIAIDYKMETEDQHRIAQGHCQYKMC